VGQEQHGPFGLEIGGDSKARKGEGSNCSAPTSASCQGLCVSSSTSQACPMLCIQEPMSRSSVQTRKDENCVGVMSRKAPTFLTCLSVQGNHTGAAQKTPFFRDDVKHLTKVIYN